MVGEPQTEPAADLVGVHTERDAQVVEAVWPIGVRLEEHERFRLLKKPSPVTGALAPVALEVLERLRDDLERKAFFRCALDGGVGLLELELPEIAKLE